MESNLPPFPVDDVTLASLKHALGGAYDIDGEGNPFVVGADFNLSQLLDFLSGDAENPRILVGRTFDGTPIYELLNPVYSTHDVIAALIDEIERLRVKSTHE